MHSPPLWGKLQLRISPPARRPGRVRLSPPRHDTPPLLPAPAVFPVVLVATATLVSKGGAFLAALPRAAPVPLRMSHACPARTRCTHALPWPRVPSPLPEGRQDPTEGPACARHRGSCPRASEALQRSSPGGSAGRQGRGGRGAAFARCEFPMGPRGAQSVPQPTSASHCRLPASGAPHGPGRLSYGAWGRGAAGARGAPTPPVCWATLGGSRGRHGPRRVWLRAVRGTAGIPAWEDPLPPALHTCGCRVQEPPTPAQLLKELVATSRSPRAQRALVCGPARGAWWPGELQQVPSRAQPNLLRLDAAACTLHTLRMGCRPGAALGEMRYSEGPRPSTPLPPLGHCRSGSPGRPDPPAPPWAARGPVPGPAPMSPDPMADACLLTQGYF